jgi:polyisoprenoid-binding protein YceI
MTMTSPRRFLATATASLAVFLIAFAFLATNYTPAADAQEATADATAAVDAAYIYTVDSAQSWARYRAQEVLRTQGAIEAVGETQAIIGTMYFDETYVPLAGSRFDIDLRTLVSDEPNRDNHLYNDTLETGEFPLTTFVITSVVGLDDGLADGEEAAFQLAGDLNVHGVTNEATWEVTASREGETITGFGTTTIVIEDYGMEKPHYGPVVSIEDEIVLEIDVVAVPAAV